jgi:formylglycine-generating enzyme required for sulfatase activity
MRHIFLAALAAAAFPAVAAATETIGYSYDARGRLVKVERTGSPSGATNTNYEFDKVDNRTARTVAVPLSFSVADASVTEGNFLYVIVTKAGSTSQSCTVDYTTADGTGNDAATHPADYGGASSTITFTASQTSFQLSFAVHSDGLTEGPEKMRILLSNPSCGAIISDGEATGTISDP